MYNHFMTTFEQLSLLYSHDLAFSLSIVFNQ